MPKEYHAIVFDLDGTLVDSEVIWERANTAIAESFGKKYTRDIHCAMMGTPALESIRIMRERLDLPLDDEAFIALREREFSKAFASATSLAKPGADELLRTIRRQKIPLALATSADQPYAEEVLTRLNWKSLFQAVVFTTEVPNGKPAPDIYLEAARRLGIQPEACIGIEDSPAGVASVKSAGMYTVGVRDERFVVSLAGADQVVDSLVDIFPRILMNLSIRPV